MTELREESYEIPAAPLGEENPLPDFRGERDDSNVTLADNVPEEDRTYMGWRTAFRVLPHRMQDGYTRRKTPRAFRAIVLENEWLRAVFLPDVGGKLASLVHKPTNRELLDRNPVFQPSNLALRDAWTSGGIEWNAGQLGHHYLTCSPVFAARVEGPRGVPVLRIYEWDRVKCFPWQIDFFLPPTSSYLFSRVRIVNPHDHELAMYWWTNVAVPEAEDVRVLAPAETALHNAPEGIAMMTLPQVDGRDVTYSTNNPKACEFFFRVPSQQRKWVTALDKDGLGLIQTSTDRLRGRKMFCWGMSTGGRRWQEFLAVPGQAYIEIQAGLARTQLESLPMPARAEWTWTEAFGLIEVAPHRIHSANWCEACLAVDAALETVLPRASLEDRHGELAAVTVRAPDELLARGSGWAALERLRIEKQRAEDRIPAELVFDSNSLVPDQQPWLALLNDGALPDRRPEEGPGHYMVQQPWRDMLEEGLDAGRGDHWLSWLHLGVMRLEARDTEGAVEAFERSHSRTPNCWALRNLAVIDRRAGHPDRAKARLLEAWSGGPAMPQLAVECVNALVEAGSPEELERFLEGLPESVRAVERIRVMCAKVALDQGRWQDVTGFFDYEFATMREGETTLADLWFRYHELRLADEEGLPIDDALKERVRREYPPPAHIDFRIAS